MKTTITLNDDLFRALKVRAAESGETVSAMIEAALVEQMFEDLEDLKTLRERKNELAVDFVARIQALAAEPTPVGSKKIKGSQSSYRLRQGNCRVVYAVHKHEICVVIVKVGHRREAYR